MSDEFDLQEPDETRPAKRARFEGSLATTLDTRESMADEDDWDDVYGDNAPGQTAAPQRQDDAATPAALATVASAVDAKSDAVMEDAPRQQPEPTFQPPAALNGQSNTPVDQITQHASDVVMGNDELVAPIPPVKSTDDESTRVLEQNVEVEMPDTEGLAASANAHGVETETNGSTMQSVPPHEATGTDQQPEVKPADDPEFLAAAAAQKGQKDAEWQFDSSDADSSSDSDSTDSSDEDSDDEEGYELLDPATAARMLMSGDGDDEDGERGKGKGEYQPRTANEKQEEVVPKPDVVVTPDMKITFVGVVERIVDNLLLIKGATPGEYQVLEGGSVLCTEDRKVIGCVAETLGRVQEPLYSVAFTNAKEIEDDGIVHGTRLFYVDSHSTFVFTQPLRNTKGTDASNIHDEEVGEDELEFSDDEVEAEYKRQRKLAKKSGRGGLSRGDFNDGVRIQPQRDFDSSQSYARGNDAPAQSYGGGMSYDDDEPVEEFYSPLKRPDNLSQAMANGGSAPRGQHSQSDRGRDRGGFRGRGRGDRGRGRGGFDRGNQRGGRGGGGHHNNAQQSHRGNAQSFPDRHNSYSDNSSRQEKHALPPKPNERPQAAPPAFQYQNAQPPAQQTYQFGGYTFQYGSQPPAPQQQQPQYNVPQVPMPGGFAPSIPQASHANPMYAGMSYPAQQSQPPQSYAPYNAQTQNYYQQPPAQYGYPPQVPAQAPTQQQPQAQQSSGTGQSGQIDLSQILRNLGAPRQ